MNNPVVGNRRGLAGLADQNTVVLTSYRRNGAEIDTPVHIVVEGDHAFIRTYAATWKAKRLRRNPEVVLWRTTIGTRNAILATTNPKAAERIGPGIPARVRFLSGSRYRDAARALRRKFPLAHGLLIPLSHRLMRTETINLELTDR